MRQRWPNGLEWVVLMLVPLLSWVIFLREGTRASRRDLIFASGAYAAGACAFGALVVLGGPATAVLFALWAGGIVHTCAVRGSVERQRSLVDPWRLDAASRLVERRRYGRRLMSKNPTLARALGVGRPDVFGADSCGLVDVNHAGPSALARLPGLTTVHVMRIVEHRDEGGMLVSAEDLALLLHLPLHALAPLRDEIAFDLEE